MHGFSTMTMDFPHSRLYIYMGIVLYRIYINFDAGKRFFECFEYFVDSHELFRRVNTRRNSSYISRDSFAIYVRHLRNYWDPEHRQIIHFPIVSHTIEIFALTRELFLRIWDQLLASINRAFRHTWWSNLLVDLGHLIGLILNVFFYVQRDVTF